MPRVGGIQSAPGAQAVFAPEAAGTERVRRGGVSLAPFQANSEGPHRGASQLGRSRRNFGPQRVGTRKARTAAHSRGKKEAGPEG